jgi:hypothetical protein
VDRAYLEAIRPGAELPVAAPYQAHVAVEGDLLLGADVGVSPF